MSRPEGLLEYQRLLLEAHQFFESVVSEDRRLLMFHSIPYRKTYMGSTFKYTSFILWTLEVQ